jgi:hypothetical protein
MCLNETYSKVRVGKYLSDKFSMQHYQKQGDVFIATVFQLCFIVCPENQMGLKLKNGTSTASL